MASKKLKKSDKKSCNKKYTSNITQQDVDATTMDSDFPTGDDGGGMSEAIKMPSAPTDADKNMKDMSGEHKKKTLSAFTTAASEAKKRQKYKDENDELAVTRMKRGVRFYDKQGSGYLKGGKKTYD